MFGGTPPGGREGGALPGAVLPVAVFLAVKATGGAGLARWERVSVGVWPYRGATVPPASHFLEGATV